MTRRRRAARRAVLGIDAAWTTTEPSGVAVVVEEGRRWRCRVLAPSYAAVSALVAGTPVRWDAAPAGGPPDPARLLADVRALCREAEVAVVAVDMPLAAGPITRRRAADDAISRTFGARGCGTHSPTASRPGAVAARTYAAFTAAGFRLATRPPPTGRDLLEVFPHLAAMALLGARYRVPYKLARSARYWPGASPRERARRLVATWRRLAVALGRDVDGIALPIPAHPPSLASLKRYEDALDALACAWTGIQFLRGRTRPHGDASAAIWVPAEGA